MSISRRKYRKLLVWLLWEGAPGTGGQVGTPPYSFTLCSFDHTIILGGGGGGRFQVFKKKAFLLKNCDIWPFFGMGVHVSSDCGSSRGSPTGDHHQRAC